MSGPSEKATDAALAAQIAPATTPWANEPEAVARGLVAAHDPALGLDRSVCLRDVVEALGHAWVDGGPEELVDAADFIEREFGGGS